MVPNPDLENFSSCPTAALGMTSCDDWFEMNNHQGSPDYYNACAAPGTFNVPDNLWGFQNAHSGSAYLGVLLYNTGDHKEYVYCELTSPMIAGENYDISFWVSLADGSSVGVDNGIGVYFTNTTPTGDLPVTNGIITTAQPQFENTTLIDDVLTWVEISFTYTAQGGEQFMSIGNFNTDANMNLYSIGTPLMLASYLYLDNFKVEPECSADWDLPVVCSADGLLDLDALITGNTGGTWSGTGVSANTFDPSVGSQNVTYQSPCGEILTQFIEVLNSPQAQFATNDTEICENNPTVFTDMSLVNTSPIISWSWDFGDGQNSTDQNPTHVYASSGNSNVELTVVNAAGCSSSETMGVVITIHPLPIADFTYQPNPVELGDQVSFENASHGAISWDWSFGDGSYSTDEFPVHAYENYGSYSVELTVHSDHCSHIARKDIVIKEELIFYLPNSFSPNADGTNDKFLPIFASGFNPYDYHFSIFNRSGDLVFESTDISEGWNGKREGVKELSPGVYVWKLEIAESASAAKRVITGHVSLLR